MDKQTAICDFLKKHHTGKERAVPSRELERLFSLEGRTLRRKINRLRQDGHRFAAMKTAITMPGTSRRSTRPCAG